MIVKKLFKYITGKRIRATLKPSLSIAGTFYLLDSSYSIKTLINYKTANISSLNVFQFLSVYALIIFTFYYLLDFGLRYLFLKKMKKSVLATVREEKRQKKIETLRDLSAFKTWAVDFIFDYPVELGYFKPEEIGPIEELKISDKEKDDAIVELVGQLIRWICTVVHLLITLIVVYNYYPILMSCFLFLGAILILVLIPGIMIFIENIEVVPLFLKAMDSRRKSLNHK
jgi:hypothetical protein